MGAAGTLGLLGLETGCGPRDPHSEEVTGASGSKAKQPNIIVIMADDMGFSDIGCYGAEISTPNLDRLASGGLRFTQFYNMARCCPTRACLLTGLYPHQAGIGLMTEALGVPAYQGELNRQCVTIGEALRPAGYRTAIVGKWHVTPGFRTESKHNWPLQRGFEKYYGEILGAGSYYDPPFLVRGNTRVEPDGPGKDYFYTDAVTDAAVDSIEESSQREEPFFLYTAYTAPHWPLHALPEDVERYRALYRAGWDALRSERHHGMIEMGLVQPDWAITERDKKVPSWGDAPHQAWQIERMAVYAAMIDQMDRGVGRIMETLRETGQEENTLVLFLADNGGCAEELPRGMRNYLTGPAKALVPEFAPDGRPVRSGNHPSIFPGPPDTYASYGVPWANASNTPFRLYKHWIHEGGIATPLIAYWPGVIRNNEITHQPGQATDIMATCVDVAGAKYPETFGGESITPMEGRTLVPIFEGQRSENRDAMYWEHEGNRAVRKDEWKLVTRYPGDWELYNLEADRTERNNLAQRHPEKVAELAALYSRWADRCGVLPRDEIKKLIG